MRARGHLKTTLFAGNSDPEKKIWIESSPTSDQKFQNWANDGILIQLPEARSYTMDLLETAYQKLDEVRAHLYQKTVPVRTAAVQPQLHIHFLTATRDIFKKGISI